jgi:hypothetical protein
MDFSLIGTIFTIIVMIPVVGIGLMAWWHFMHEEPHFDNGIEVGTITSKIGFTLFGGIGFLLLALSTLGLNDITDAIMPFWAVGCVVYIVYMALPYLFNR